MTVTITARTAGDKTASLVTLQTEITALATQAATSGPQQASQAQLLKQKQESLVLGALDARRLDPATLISTMSVNTNIDPAVGAAITKLSSQVGGAADTLLRGAQIQAIQNAFAKGQINAASVLSTMS